MKAKNLILSLVFVVFAFAHIFSNTNSITNHRFGKQYLYNELKNKSSYTFNSIIVTNTNSSGIGSLRQAIIDANSNLQADSILFNIPLTDPGYNASRGIFRIYVTGSELNPITRNNLVIDGFSQTRFTGNTNTALLGTGGTVGVDSVSFPKFEGVEIEIVDSSLLTYGLKISASGVKISGLSIFGFGNGFIANHGNIVVIGTIKHVVIENNILGTPADQLIMPDSALYTRGCNISLNTADSGIIKNNLLAWAGSASIYATVSADYWLIEYNESSHNGFFSPVLDGMDFASSSGFQIVRYNKIHNNAANGTDTYLSKGYNLIENNTIYENGVINWENSGIRIYGNNDIIRKNIIHSNRGSGILVTSSANYHKITQNSIWGNGAFSSNGIPATHSIGINLITSTENHSRGTAPFYTLNDIGDYDIGGNDMINYPVITSAKILPSTVEFEGYALNGAEIEFFIGDTLSSSLYPQGRYYLYSATEGSSSDLNSDSGIYGPLPINGINQGNDSCTKFKFSFPKLDNILNGTIITATATVNNSTSEFSPAAKAVLGTSDVLPVLDCIYTNSNGNYTAVFGYNNPNNINITIPIGNTNGFISGSQDSGQPIVFLPGNYTSIFSVEFSNSLTWNLGNLHIIADSTSNKCPVDLSIDKKVIIPDLTINDSVFKNDTITFQIKIKNTSSFPSANIIVLDTLPLAFNYISFYSTNGLYNATTGKWKLDYLASKDSAMLNIKAIVDTSGHNTAKIISQSQPDFNLNNNSSFASITISNSSTGNNGGLESNGNMASLIAKRNFYRHKSTTDRFDRSDNLETFTFEKVTNNKIKTSKISKSTNSEIINFIPQYGPLNSQAFITTPMDLIGISNAIEVFSVDYYKGNNTRKAAILGIASSPGTVYEHTKLICDRLDGATLDDIKHINIAGYPFILAKMVQENGEVDYAVSFIAYKNGNTYSIDNRWDLETYHPTGNHAVINFQVWSVSERYTVQLIESIINLINTNGYSVNILNKYPPTIPMVYVRNGHYKSGNLYLEIQNNAEASALFFNGNVAYVEDGNRFDFSNFKTISSNNISQVVVPTTGIFDIGFSMINNAMGGKDILYYADGPWGIDYEESGASIYDFSISSQISISEPNEYELSRNVYAEGSVKDYVSIFRALKVGNKPVDITDYNGIKFSAIGSGTFDVVISKKSISQWNMQYKTSVNLSYSLTDYYIPFSQLANNLGQHNFTAQDVVTVTFVKKGNNTSYQNFTLSVKNLRFTGNSVEVEEVKKETPKSSINVNPNPFNRQTKISFNINEPSNVMISIYDTEGKELEIISTDFYQEGSYSVDFTAKNLKQGIYIIKLQTDKETRFSKVVLLN